MAARALEFFPDDAQGSAVSHEATLAAAPEALGTAWLVVNFSFISSSAFAVPLMAPTTQIAAKYLFNIALHLKYRIKLPTLCGNNTNITYRGQIQTDLKKPNTYRYFINYLYRIL